VPIHYAEAATLPSPPPELLRNASLFLDFDGTLVEIAARPDHVQVGQQLCELVGSLNAALSGRLAIVSGRPAADICALLDDMTIVIAGSHGAELLSADGHYIADTHATRDADLPGDLDAFVQRHPGVLVERKPFGLALHFRQAPHAEAACRQLVSGLAAQTGLMLQTGKQVIELRPADADKGTALRALLVRAPMAGGRPVFVGDDDTDEAGFATAARLGGAGILVGPPRPTHALYRLESVSDTLRWLDEAREGLP
jgi:trehalose 6-phosphate phosphatase